MGNRLLTEDDFSFTEWNDLEDDMLITLNNLITEWWFAGKEKRTPEWRRLIEHIPAAFLYRRTCTLNYEVLANMWQYRRTHKLQEWKDFLEILEEELPYSQLWTLKDCNIGV
jgi:hypothetical protein